MKLKNPKDFIILILVVLVIGLGTLVYNQDNNRNNNNPIEDVAQSMSRSMEEAGDTIEQKTDELYNSN